MKYSLRNFYFIEIVCIFKWLTHTFMKIFWQHCKYNFTGNELMHAQIMSTRYKAIKSVAYNLHICIVNRMLWFFFTNDNNMPCMGYIVKII